MAPAPVGHAVVCPSKSACCTSCDILRWHVSGFVVALACVCHTSRHVTVLGIQGGGRVSWAAVPLAITSRPSAKEKARANSSPCGLLSARALQRWPVVLFFAGQIKARANDPRHRGYHQLGLSKHWPFITFTLTMRLHRRQYSSKFSAVVSGRICSRYRGCSQVGHKAQPFFTAISLP